MKTKFCTACGNEIGEDWQNCPNCGMPLNTNSPEAKHLNPFQARFKRHDGREYKKPYQVQMFGLLATIFGIFSLVFGCGFIIFSNAPIIKLLEFIFEILFGISAIILGGFGLLQDEMNNLAYTGLIMGGIEFLLFWYLIIIF